MKLRLTLVCFLIATFGAEASQNYFFNHYTTADGLPSNTIYCALQDSNGYMWIGTRDGISLFNGKSFHNFGDIEGKEEMSGSTGSMCLDNDGCVWFTSPGGVICADPGTGTMRKFELPYSVYETIVCDCDNNIWVINGDITRINKSSGKVTLYREEDNCSAILAAVDSYGTLWVTDSNGDLYQYSPISDRFIINVSGYGFLRVISLEESGLLLSSKDGRIYIMDTSLGLVRLLIDNGPEGNDSNVHALLERTGGEYWIGTEEGIIVYSREEGRIMARIHNNTDDPHSLSADYIQYLGKDREGNVWAGTFYTGLNLWLNKKKAYNFYYDDKTPATINGNIVRSIISTGANTVWIATEDGYIDEMNIHTNTVTHHEIDDNRHNCHDILQTGDRLWIATFDSGIFVYDIRGGKTVKHYDLSTNSIIKLLRTGNDRILAGTRHGLYTYIPETDGFELVACTAGCFIHTLFQDSGENIWVGTYGNGIYLLDKNMQILRHFSSGTGERNISSDNITFISEDSRKRIWIATEGGGLNFTTVSEIQNPRFRKITKKEGMPSNIICAVAENKDGDLWVSTSKGLIELDPVTCIPGRAYFTDSQITGNQYSYGAVYCDPNGTIFFGTSDGIVSVNPAALKASRQERHIYIDRVTASSIDSTVILPVNNVNSGQSVTLKVKQKDIATLTIHYSSPCFSDVIEPLYQFTLLKGRRSTLSKTTDNEISLSGLTSGAYRFDISLPDENNDFSHRSLKLQIVPPFNRSAAAIALYILAVLSALCLIISYIWKYRKERSKRGMDELLEQQSRDIYESKINFFTNLTHEIRSPLSLIKMPVDKIIQKKGCTPECEKDMLTVQANVDKLLTLTNELLDINRLENNDRKLSFTRGDIVRTVENTLSRHKTLIEDRKIKVMTDIPSEPLYMMYAEESVSKIVSNLLSNAIKYGGDEIGISLKRKDNGTVVIAIDSNGEKLSQTDSARIFEKFYTGGKGTGLGLPLSRILAEMHGGKLYVDYNVGNVNRFVLELPVEHPEQIVIKDSLPSVPDESEGSEEFDSSKHTVLIVEDDIDLRAYLSGELSETYNILSSGNGKEALGILESEKVDLVISDIMMPVMDGCELCDYIKTNIEYSHVPILMLTAAVGMETRMKTLKVGADGYLEKPFSMDLLKAMISNLFKNKEIAFNQFANSPLTHYKSVAANKVDDEFMNRVHTVVMDNIADQELGISTLTSLLNTSKSSLYRKLKANTGLNINEYIRLCRLKQAAEMLSSQKYRVNEVGYLVGFSSPSYFATCFQKQFNISPSAFVKQLKD